MSAAELAAALLSALRACDLRAELIDDGGPPLVYGVNVWPPYRHADRYPATTVWVDEADDQYLWGDTFEYAVALSRPPEDVAHRVLATLPKS